MKKESMVRDSYILAERYIEEDLKEFVSVEKYKLLEMEKILKKKDENKPF